MTKIICPQCEFKLTLQQALSDKGCKKGCMFSNNWVKTNKK